MPIAGGKRPGATIDPRILVPRAIDSANRTLLRVPRACGPGSSYHVRIGWIGRWFPLCEWYPTEYTPREPRSSYEAPRRGEFELQGSCSDGREFTSITLATSIIDKRLVKSHLVD